MKKLVATIAVLLLMVSAASAGNTVKQAISMTSSGGQISQSAANAAVVRGNNNHISQGVIRAHMAARSLRAGPMQLWWWGTIMPSARA